MKSSKLTLVARLLLGLMFFVFGLNKFLGFLPQPPLPDSAGQMMGALAQSGYFFPVLAASEVVAGALLLSGWFVPLALLILAPIVLHIILFHVFLAPAGTAMGVIALALGIYLAWAYRENFKPVLQK